MDVSDNLLLRNRDWDPSYLKELVSEDFYDFSELWNINSGVQDKDLVTYCDNMEKYCPIVEDISLEDEVLCHEVEKIEEE